MSTLLLRDLPLNLQLDSAGASATQLSDLLATSLGTGVKVEKIGFKVRRWLLKIKSCGYYWLLTQSKTPRALTSILFTIPPFFVGVQTLYIWKSQSDLPLYFAITHANGI